MIPSGARQRAREKSPPAAKAAAVKTAPASRTSHWVRPPLPESVKTVDFFAPSGPSRRYFSGEAKSKRKLSVKKLRRGNGKVPERMVSRRGRIIY